MYIVLTQKSDRWYEVNIIYWLIYDVNTVTQQR